MRYLLFPLLAVTLTADQPAPMPDPAKLMRIVQSVQQNILRLPEYSLFDDLRFSVEDDTVILTGQASRSILKTAAENAVKRIEGVERVENHIEVLPFQGFDEDIRFRAYQATYSHPALNRYDPNRGSPVFVSAAALQQGLSLDPPIGHHSIHIIVRNSRVRLTGVVQTIGDKTIAGLIANNVSSVFEVQNDLAVADEMTPIRYAKAKQARR